jgi:hypothetical protein
MKSSKDPDMDYQFTSHLRADIRALHLFDCYPTELTAALLSHYDNLARTDQLRVQQYPSFSPIGGCFYIFNDTCRTTGRFAC